VHFGATLRLLRIDAGFGLRELAGHIGVSSAYLSRVEHGHDRTPTPDRLIAIADALGIPRQLLLELARQTGPAVSGYLDRVPAASVLLFEIARRNLGAGDIARIKAFVDTEFPMDGDEGRRASAAPTRLRELLAPSRVVLGVSCGSVDDLVGIAASKLPIAAGVTQRALALAILEREREAPTLLGAGFMAPHAIVGAAPSAAVLATLVRPLPIDAPDMQPVRVAVVMVSEAAGRPHLEMLARVARIATPELSDELVQARSAEEILAAIERVESAL